MLLTLTDPAEVWVQAVETRRGIAYRRILLAAFTGRELAASAVVAEEHPLGQVGLDLLRHQGGPGGGSERQ